MPKTKLQNIIFTLIMAFVMVYAMVCYNIALDKGGMTNEIFLLAFYEIPIMWPVACILEYFVVEKLSRKLAFRMVSPEDKPIFITLALCWQIFFAGPGVRNVFGFVVGKNGKKQEK